MVNINSIHAFEDFDPVSDLISEEKSDTLILYLPGFRKEQLKVQLTTSHILRISGERLIGDGKWRRFIKEFKIPPNVDTKGITAKFEGGILQIRQPKLITSEAAKPQTQQEAPSSQPQLEKTNDGFVTPPSDIPGSRESEAKEEKKDAKEDTEASRKEDEIPSKGEETETKRESAEKRKLVNGSRLIKELRNLGERKQIGVFVLLFLVLTLLGLYSVKMHTRFGDELQSVLKYKNEGFQGPSPT
ncbi:hypothetical protein RND81_05G258000 [Saponaria officinalis]|uniref:SHSP domain-containing protein n=1 Tax=Saponaria officinalis TaxID=3572 RepID=A0AAW1L1U0_SAPOF